MKKLSLKQLIISAKKLLQLEAKHAAFIAVIFVLLTYVFLVWKIGSYSNAEPTETDPINRIPQVDKKAIKNIEELESSNQEIKAFFNEARRNPFQE